ncbi:hypothetical protein L1787_06810 [Acuticoccus sp. M5D2P5]|uniref:2-keto-4-pentenoate hydratase n=1 Tax=Acuticoccus kalidii TaxID=2910977 RepID=UPI001F42249B|nr:fumarylacetoacetate hydrolase family protein [Acuticoccus kalidii]MCF3933125.1 hypothetical protein [Acuticoccus kalidii]
MQNDTARNLADILITARETGLPAPFQSASPFADMDRDTINAVQQLVCDACGPAGAWKAGPKSGDTPPLAAPIFDDVVRGNGGPFSQSELIKCGVELEIAFRLEKPLPPVDAPNFAVAARECVRPVVAIELVDGRFENFTELPDAVKMADNQLNGGFVWANPETPDAEVDFSTPEVRLSFNGEVVCSGRQKVPGGDAYATFVTFAQYVGNHCGGFQVGQIVTTGSLSGMLFVEPGTKIEGWVAGLGGVETTYV